MNEKEINKIQKSNNVEEDFSPSAPPPPPPPPPSMSEEGKKEQRQLNKPILSDIFSLVEIQWLEEKTAIDERHRDALKEIENSKDQAELDYHDDIIQKKYEFQDLIQKLIADRKEEQKPKVSIGPPVVSNWWWWPW
jgi:hypothetical protein